MLHLQRCINNIANDDRIKALRSRFDRLENEKAIEMNYF